MLGQLFLLGKITSKHQFMSYFLPHSPHKSRNVIIQNMKTKLMSGLLERVREVLIQETKQECISHPRVFFTSNSGIILDFIFEISHFSRLVS